MFKQFISSMMVAAILTVNASASTTATEGLKEAFNELNYALTVEWNQTDKSFHEEQMQKFSSAIRDLQKQGLTKVQMVEFMKSEIQDEKVAKEVEETLNMIALTKMSTAEASKLMVSTMKHSFGQGASFNGEAVLHVAVGILLIGMAVAVASGNASVVVYNSCRERFICDTWCEGWYCYENCYYTCY